MSFVASNVVVGQPRYDSPDAVLYTDGSASAERDSADWGVHVSRSGESSHTLWGPVFTYPQDSMAWGRPTHQQHWRN